MGIIPNLSTGIFGQRTYDMIVTNYRLIFARPSKETVNQEHEKAMAGVQGEGLLTRWKTSIASGFNYHQRYYQMPPEAILREGPDNFEIRPEQVTKIRVYPGQFIDDYSNRTSHTMKIKWSGGKIKYSFDQTEPSQIVNLLKPMLGNRVK